MAPTTYSFPNTSTVLNNTITGGLSSTTNWIFNTSTQTASTTFTVPNQQGFVNINLSPFAQGGVVSNPAPMKVLPPRNFNKYVNASDLLEEFIQFLGDNGVRQKEVRGLPVDLFIKWLVIRACEEDKEEPNVTLEIPAHTQTRCICCKRYMKPGPVPFDRPVCAERYFQRAA